MNIYSMMQFILIITVFTIYGNCIPTSLLSHTKNIDGLGILHHNDYLSSGSSLPSSSTTIATTTTTEPIASELKDKVLLKGTSEVSHAGNIIKATANQQYYKMTPHKRGIIGTQHFNEKDLSKNIGINNLRSGIAELEDGIDSAGLSSSSYPDALDVIEDYQKSVPSSDYDQRQHQQQQSNDNVDNIFNHYEEPIALPLVEYHQQLPIFSNYYTDGRRKRASSNNKHKLSLRLKRESKLSASDLLALLALINANEGNNMERFSSTRADNNDLSLYNSYFIDDNKTHNNNYDNQLKDHARSSSSSSSLQQYEPRQIIDEQPLQYLDNNNENYGNTIDYLQNDNGEWWNYPMNEQNIIGRQYDGEQRFYDEYPISSRHYLLPRHSKRRYMVGKRFIGGFDTRYNTPDVYSSSSSTAINNQFPFNKNYYE